MLRLRRYQVVNTVLLGHRYPYDGYVVWDWKTRKWYGKYRVLTTDISESTFHFKGDARRFARFLNRHQWLV